MTLLNKDLLLSAKKNYKASKETGSGKKSFCKGHIVLLLGQFAFVKIMLGMDLTFDCGFSKILILLMKSFSLSIGLSWKIFIIVIFFFT